MKRTFVRLALLSAVCIQFALPAAADSGSWSYGSGCWIDGASWKSPGAVSLTSLNQWCTETYNSHSYVQSGTAYNYTPGWLSYSQSWPYSGVTSMFSTHGGAIPFGGRSSTFHGTSDY
mgnify:CR=1 FL=1